MGDISKNFSRAEFSCRDKCGQDTIDAELITVLEDIRTHFKKAIIVTCGNRCPKHNKAVGGSINSQHLKGRAADIVVKDINAEIIYRYLRLKYPSKYGLGLYSVSEFVHIDTRSNKARWVE